MLLAPTMMRLRGKLRVTTFNDMPDEQRQYCSDYHNAMVTPFLRNLLVCTRSIPRPPIPNVLD